MLKNNIELLKKAFLDASLIEMSAFLDGTENDDHNFSLEFEQKINSVIEEAGKPQKHLNKRKIITIVAAVILISLMFTVVVLGEHFGVFSIFKTERSVDFIVDKTITYPKIIENEYYPIYIPNGFTLTYQDIGFPIYKTYEFSNAKSKIEFEQMVVGNGIISVSNDYEKYQIMEIGNKRVHCFESVNNCKNIIICEYEKYIFKISFDTTIGLEEGFKIIESIQEK